MSKDHRPPRRAVVRVDPAAHNGHDHGDIAVHTNLGQLDPCDLPEVFGAIAAHLDLDPVAMRKAVRGKGEPPDPRFPELTALIEAARRNWRKWGDQLIDEVRKLHAAGKLVPMTPANEALLFELFADHEVKLVVQFAGHHPDRKRYDRLVKEGKILATTADASFIDIAFRLAAGLDHLSVHDVKTDTPPMADIVRQAMAVKLTPKEREALAYAKRRAGEYMRVPAGKATTQASRVLTEAQGAALRGGVASAVESRLTGNALTQKLREAVTGHPSLTNDLDRVGRTELAFAHGFAGYVKLKEQTAAAGMGDPWVYKFCSPRSCADCRRIWGPPGNPIRYRLSFIEKREAAGGNFGLPRRQWGPVTGPVHPNCTEGTLQVWTEELVSSILSASERFMATYYRK